MSSTLVLSGSLVECPSSEVADTLDHKLTLARGAERRQVVLNSDAAYVIDLDGATDVSAIKIESDNKVTARLTSADGASQLIPVDPLAILFSRSVPFTALALIRVAGQVTTVDLILGQKLS